jgi:hypothetical protein
MARAAHPHAMKSEKPSPTRTAPPQMPDQFPSGGRYRSYTLFDATGFVYLLLGLIAVRVVWARACWTSSATRSTSPSTPWAW